MNHIITKALLVFGLFFLFSCGGDDDENLCEPESFSSLTIRFHPVWNGEAIEAGSEFEDQFGNRLRLFNFKAYFSQLYLSNDETESDLGLVELLNFNDGIQERTYQVPDNSSFTKLHFSTGVPEEYNVDYDPSLWPNDNPLSVQGAQGMHWGWNTGYIFTKFDGKADTTDAVEPTFLYPFAFHTGDDAFFMEHEFDIDISSSVNSDHELDVYVNTEMLLNAVNSIDIRVDGETHTGGDFELAQEFIDNYNECFSIE